MSTETSDSSDPVEEPADGGETIREATWQETQAAIDKRQQETRELVVELEHDEETGETVVAPFVIGGLDKQEEAEVERVAEANTKVNRAKRRRRNEEPEVEQEMEPVYDKLVELGVVEGPEGFKAHREDHREQLPLHVKKEIADEVNELSSLSVVDRRAFQ